MRRVMVLGGSGFIGRQCIIHLLRTDDIIVHGVSRVEPDWMGDYPGRIFWHEINVHDAGAIQNLIFELRPTYALHLGWYAGHGTIWITPENLDWAAATLRMARSFAAAGCKRLVITGTCAEYSGSGKFAENSSSEPETLYGKSKNCTRILVEALCKSAEISFAWPRLFHMYGPYENPKRLISGAICALLNGKDFNCSDGGQTRDFLHVEDVGDALSHLLLSPVQGVINLGSGQPVTIGSLLTKIGECLDKRDLIKLGSRPRALNDPDLLIPDITRQTLELNWQPKFSAANGIAHTVQWWRKRLSK
jgi:nucleoside-diphosphate-sugar epimerase